jgi:hypothetical protein
MSGNIPNFLREYIKRSESTEVDGTSDDESGNDKRIFGYNIVPVISKSVNENDLVDSDSSDEEDIVGDDSEYDSRESDEENPRVIQKKNTATATNVDADVSRKSVKQVPVDDFYLNNRQKFVKFIMDRFKDVEKEYNTSKSTTRSSGLNIMLSQRIVMSYLNLDSPYRGLLLYHGLGSGKTISSIAIFAEGYQNKQILVVCPKQLINNYQEEVKLFNTSFPDMKIPEKIEIDGKITKKIKYFGYTSSTDMALLKEENLNNKVIVIDEVHNFSNAIVNALKDPLNKSSKKISTKKMTEEEDAKFLEKKVKNIEDIMNKRNENSEPEEMKRNWEKIRTLFNKFDTNEVDKDRDITNNEPMSVEEKKLLRKDIIDFYEKTVHVVTTKNIIPIYENMKSAINTRFILLSGTPVINRPFELTVLYNILRGNIITYKYLLQSIKNPDTLKRSLKEIRDIDYFNISFPSNKNNKYIVEVTQNPKKFINIEQDVFKKKREIRDMEQDFDERILGVIQKHSSQKNIQKETISYTAFPEKEEVFKKYYSDPILNNINKSNKDSKEKNDSKKEAEELFSKRIIGLSSYFKGVDDESMAKLNTINISLEMSAYQATVYNRDIKREKTKGKGKNTKDAVESSSYKVKSRQTCDFALPESCSTNIPDNYNQEDTTNIVQCIDDLMSKDQNFMKLDAQEETNKLERYSPKYKKVIEQLNNRERENRGTHLIYSNFIVRGTDILSMALERNEYVEMKVEKDGNSIKIKNIKEVKEKSGKVFIAYRTSDSVAVKLAKRKIYNNDWNELADKEKMPDGNMMNFEQLKNQLNEFDNEYQLYGKLAKAFIISKSSAEGINLKNTRFVHLLDPFWNPAVTTQVIGRARRLNSHEALPQELRNITVYKYLMTLKSSNKIGTTDQQLDKLSEIKKQETNTFLKLVKSASIDCMIHNKSKSKSKTDDDSGYKCFAFPPEKSGDPGWTFIPDTTRKEN